MSMIGGLIDELNKSADKWNASNMFELARMCREAADTISELHDCLLCANEAVRDAEHDESMAWDRVRKAEADADKLRKLVRDYEHCSVHADCAKCEYDGKLSEHCPYSPCFPDINELSELGVEVDG